MTFYSSKDDLLRYKRLPFTSKKVTFYFKAYKVLVYNDL